MGLMFRNITLIACLGISGSLFAQQSARLAASGQERRIAIDPIADYVIPIVYDGTGYTTSFFLTNRDSKTLHLGVYFYANDGSPVALPIQGLGRTSGISVNLDVNQSSTFQTTGQSSSFIDAYAVVFTFDR